MRPSREKRLCLKLCILIPGIDLLPSALLREFEEVAQPPLGVQGEGAEHRFSFGIDPRRRGQSNVVESVVQ